MFYKQQRIIFHSSGDEEEQGQGVLMQIPCLVRAISSW